MVFNTFIGVLIEKFSYIKNTKGKYKGLSPKEKEWAIIKERIYKTQPMKRFKIPSGKFMRFLYNLIHDNKTFENWMDGCIIANSISFMVFYHRSSEDFNTGLGIKY